MNDSKAFLALIAAGGLFFGLLFIFLGWKLWSNGRELRSSGITVSATIKQKFRNAKDQSWGGLENYYLRCTFQDASGNAEEMEVKVPSKLWRQLREGQNFDITYLPGQIESAEAGPRWGWQVRGFIGVAMMLFGIVALTVIPLGILRELLSAR